MIESSCKGWMLLGWDGMGAEGVTMSEAAISSVDDNSDGLRREKRPRSDGSK